MQRHNSGLQLMWRRGLCGRPSDSCSTGGARNYVKATEANKVVLQTRHTRVPGRRPHSPTPRALHAALHDSRAISSTPLDIPGRVEHFPLNAYNPPNRLPPLLPVCKIHAPWSVNNGQFASLLRNHGPRNRNEAQVCPTH
jgi:hypothetical protein